MMTETNRKQEPLVSILVITYNSSGTVIETLESAKRQSYRNIELIVSDDCSRDNTVDICKKWISDNKERFVGTKIITSPVNTGITLNANRGLAAASGIWLKYIAGDDILLANCIQDNIDFISGNDADPSFVFSKLVQFKVNAQNKKMTNPDEKVINEYWDDLERSFFGLDAKGQYKKLLKKNYPPAVTLFVKMETLLSLGGFDERIPMIEDYPMWLKITALNHRLYFFSTETTLYRLSENSISNARKISMNFVKNLYLIYRYYKVNWHTMFNIFLHISQNVNYFNMMLISRTGKRTLINKLLQLLDPYFIQNYFFNKYDRTLLGEYVEDSRYD
jgi:glycosyltransferase involved in cell wall biosynthesis